jgi:SAM-dependent methyltransferase
MMSLTEKIVEYWDRQPCNILHSQADMNSEQYWNEITQRRYFVEPHIHDLANFSKWQGRRVLEIGCGIGTDAEQFVRHGADYTGIDVSTNSINLCKKRFEIQQLTGNFLCCDSTNPDLVKELGKFDLVYSMGVIHHCPTPDKIIHNVNCLLQDNGEFRFLVYAENSWKSAMIQSGLDQFEAQAGCPYAETYTEQKVKDLISTYFDIIDIRQDHCFMYNIAEYRQGNYVLEPWFREMPEAMRLAIKKHLGWHLCVKAIKKS